MTGEDIKQETVSKDIFLRTFYRVLQTAKIHRSDNPLLLSYITDFIGVLNYYFQEADHLSMQISRGRFYLQGKRLAYSRRNIIFTYEMLRYFKQRNLHGLRFYAFIKEAPATQVVSFADLLNSAAHHEEPLAWLSLQLKEGNYSWVDIIHVSDELITDQDTELGDRGRRAYSDALTSLQEVAKKISLQKRAGVQHAKKVIQNMVDIIMEDDTALLGLSTIRSYDDYTYTHSINVAILSICLGKRIGLLKIRLEQLGIAGLFHDLGKVVLPRELINKPGELTDKEFDEIKEHPINSVQQIIKLNASRELKSEIVRAPFEHHLGYDLTGYPQTDNKKSISLFGKIMAIADVFDAMTSPRVYRPFALSPDETLMKMWEASEKSFDPILLKVFINMLGVLPTGTLLLLDSGEMCLVLETPEDTESPRPIVVILDADGSGGFKKGEIVNLADKDTQSGAFYRNIVRSLHPSTYGIQAADFLV